MIAMAASDDALDERIAMAEAAVAALAEQFVPIVREEIARLRELAAQARAERGDNAPTIQTIFEICHNVKGQGGSFGFDLVTEIGASLCEITRHQGARSERVLNVIDHHLRVMSTVVDEGIRGDGGELGRQLIAKLRSMTVDIAA